MQNSPFVEGVDFFATAKKDQGSVGSRSQMFFRRDLGRVLPTLPRRPSVATPSARRGILIENLLADTTPALRATPSVEGEFYRLMFF